MQGCAEVSGPDRALSFRTRDQGYLAVVCSTAPKVLLAGHAEGGTQHVKVLLRCYLGRMSIIARFYDAFQRRDADAMAACYHPDARFSDPVFPDLDADQVRAMWRMLISRGQDLRITYTVLEENRTNGRAEWEAFYTFGRTGRSVHNRIEATFTFKDGLIFTHRDHFDLWRWSRQALGPSGWLLGWSPMLRKKVQATVAAALRNSMAAA